MRQVIGVLSIVAALLLGIVAVDAVIPEAGAQDATPGPVSASPPAQATPSAGAPESVELMPGVVADSFVFIEGRAEPINYRLHIAPGVTYPIVPSGALELAYVEAGSVIIQLNATVTVGELGVTGSPGQAIFANTPFPVTTGQYFVLPPGVGGELLNPGGVTATISVAGVMPVGIEATDGATPTAATPLA